jgi:hypothetical protein
MRKEFSDFVEGCRILAAVGPFPATKHGDRCGAFSLPRPPMVKNLKVIVSDGADWAGLGLSGVPFEHVSVSHPDRCPTWDEMCWVKSLFFESEECVIQYHPPRSRYVNAHERTLHLWLPVGVDVPLPPMECV